jgi:hypothetical protein
MPQANSDGNLFGVSPEIMFWVGRRIACYFRCVSVAGFVLSPSIELKWANGGTNHFIVFVDVRGRRCGWLLGRERSGVGSGHDLRCCIG